jgi:hypothetical protein
VQWSQFATTSLLGRALLFGRLPKDDASGNHKLNLGPGARGTHEREVACDASGTLWHSLQSEVSVLPWIHDNGVKPVPLSLTRKARPSAYLSSTSKRLAPECVRALRIADGFVTDAVNFIWG